MSRKRVLRAGAALLVVLVLVVGLLWVFPVLRVSAFEVTGNARTPEELVVEATGVAEGDNLVRVDAGRAAAGVAQLPWARSATVSRGWPGTLKVEVTERRAVLFTREADGEHLIDGEGVPFVIDVPPEDAVEVTGEVESYGPVADVITALPEDIRVLVSSVDVPGPRELTLRLTDGRTVYWGASESNHDKALAVQTVLQREGQHWNVSNPAMVTVR
ncbi:cell division protein FtsQ/DivIB [Corynebacterium marinum]|uniref:Cell division protein FtsQ n=1 Tax=Corynebacterium marinum DSM 44953 TaxID=1224162 RepID=A0A0B6TUK5_9CORY|nr:FtsQ-type POTRA domain-containing protein [Corynebacterium marinum]AJK69265.1 cell division protein FtsQ [Corynebacterium marinum DSM 44953]GGO16860.1 cell division protein FtsQ [Corynebacterium marinum]